MCNYFTTNNSKKYNKKELLKMTTYINKTKDNQNEKKIRNN